MSAPVRQRLRDALAAATERLGRAGVPSPSVDARALITAAARTERPLVMLDELPVDFDAELEQLLRRRESREPLQLILGRTGFRRVELRMRPGVFIPRPETELAVDLLHQHAAQAGTPPARVVDLCTGSGALAAAVRDEFPAALVLAVEVDPVAADLARENLAAVRPESTGGGPDAAPMRGAAAPVRTGGGGVLLADLLAPADDPRLAALHDLAGTADAVLSNPPYIPPLAVPRDQEVLDHDPHRALFGGGEDGLEVPRAVIAWAERLLRPGGLLVMEHAETQGEAARCAAADHGGFENVRTAQDLTGRDRFLVARRAPGSPEHGSERLTR